MTDSRHGGLKKAGALVPLALLSAAWTVSISSTGASQATADDSRPTLPDGSALPAKALEIPASVSAPASGTLGVTGEDSSQIVSASSASAIPATALAAYQRAETVIDRADTSCHLPWQLLAAIGRVESDHGRANGNTLSPSGVAQPGIFGSALDGTAGVSKIADTDAGQYDGDTSFDRAVGPMQFIPSTWSTVGVDGDGDGKRDPQDINDAALAAAVYLCSGNEDLSTSSGQSTAVYRYNHSASYVATVLSVMQSYVAGDYTAAPDDSLPATYYEPDPVPSDGPKKSKHKAKQHHPQQSLPTGPVTSTPPTTAPSGHGPASGGKTNQPKPTPTPTPTPTADPVPTAIAQPVQEVLDAVDALALCNDQLGAIPDPLHLLDGAKKSCADKVEGKTKSAALALIPNTLAAVLSWLGL
jgi:membrane-bound lytic murein transglycosylase B